MTTPNLKLTYFNAPGRAEPVRVALTLAKIPFEDHRVDFPGFIALREQGILPLGSVPILEVDGFTFTQTAAMLRYVARLASALGTAELYPDDPMEAFVVDSAIDTVNDTLSNALMPSMFERDPDKKLAMRKSFVEGPMARSFRYLDGLLQRSGGPFFCGARLTIADLLVANQLMQIRSGRLDGIGPEALAAYPALSTLLDAYLAEPRVLAYLGTRPAA